MHIRDMNHITEILRFPSSDLNPNMAMCGWMTFLCESAN